MAEKLDPNEVVSFKELLTANAIQIDALSQLLMEKEIITDEEYFTKLKEVQADYMGSSVTE
jgi:hypothetical protein